MFSETLRLYDDTSYTGKVISVKNNEVVFQKTDGSSEKKSLMDEVAVIEYGESPALSEQPARKEQESKGHKNKTGKKEGKEKSKEKPKEKVVVKEAPATKYMVTVVLNNGDRISGDILEYNGSTLRLKTDIGEVALLSGSLRAFIFTEDGLPLPVDKNYLTVILLNGDNVKCFLKSISKDGVKVSGDMGDLELPFARINKLVLPVSSLPPQKSKDFSATIELAGGDRYSGRNFSYNDGTYRLEPIWALRAKQTGYDIKSALIKNITFKNTRVVYLSDIAPSGIKETPYLDTHLPWKADQNLKGGSIKINNNIYNKGVSVQARTELIYKTGKEYSVFKGLPGIEGSAVTGSAIFRIELDGRKAYEKLLVSGVKEDLLTLDLKNVDELKITADFGSDGDFGAYVSIANPVLLKAAEEKEEAVKISEGVYRIGGITINKNTKEISFPGKIEMKSGLIEYVAVNGDGKAYESLLSTEVRPLHLQVGLILMGLTYGQNIEVRNDTAEPKGSKVDIFLEIGGKRTDLQQYIYDRVRKKPLAGGDFVFCGSKIMSGTLLAEQEGSLIATFKDPGSVIVYNSPTEPDDSGYSAYDATVKTLPENTAVTVILKAR